MNTIKKHVPDFVDGVERTVAEFEQISELLEIPFVKIFREDEAFHQYSINKNLLMAEYDGGSRWYVVGRISDTSSVNLPTFQNS